MLIFGGHPSKLQAKLGSTPETAEFVTIIETVG
jgi:hypothetical protein